MLAKQAQPWHRPWWDPAGSGSLPAGVWPEGPVWFEFLAPLTLCTSPQPGSELPGLRLIWILSPPRQHSAALKGRPGGQRGAVALLAPEPLQLYLPPAPAWPAHLSSCGENQAPQNQTSQAACSWWGW